MYGVWVAPGVDVGDASESLPCINVKNKIRNKNQEQNVLQYGMVWLGYLLVPRRIRCCERSRQQPRGIEVSDSRSNATTDVPDMP